MNQRALHLLLTTGFCCLARGAGAQDLDSPSTFAIDNIRVLGNGCSSGGYAITISPDRQAFTAVFDQFEVAMEHLPAAATVQKQCRLVFDTQHESGFEFAIVGVTVRGYADLDANTMVRQALHYGPLSFGVRETSVSLFRGPFQGDFGVF